MACPRYYLHSVLHCRGMRDFSRSNRPEPKRDFSRRDSGRRGFGGARGPKEMFHAICGKCGRDCEIPFEPRDGRPVFCNDCFEKKDEGFSPSRSFDDRRGGRFDDRRDRPDRAFRRQERPEFNRDSRDDIDSSFHKPSRDEHFAKLQEIASKLDKIIDLLTPKVTEISAVAATVDAPKKEKKTKKEPKTPKAE